MSEASYLVELRDAAPEAPVRLRELVRTMPAAERSPGVTLRPALVAAAVIALAIAVGATVVGGLTGSANERPGASEAARAREARSLANPGAPRPTAKAYPQDNRRFAPNLTAKSRLQRQDVSMSLRVKDLSGATQSAVRTTHRLARFVARPASAPHAR